MENQHPFSGLVMLLLNSQWVYMDDMEQAEESLSTALVLGTGHGTLWWLFLVFWQGKVRKFGLQLKRGS